MIAGIAIGVCLVAFLWAAFREWTALRVVGPLLLFGAIEVVAGWPAAIEDSWTDDLHVWGPVLTMALAFSSFLIGYALRMSPLRRNPRYHARELILAGAPHCYAAAITVCGLLVLASGLYLYQGMPALLPLALGQDGVSDPASIADYIRDQRFLLTKAYYFGGEYRGQGVFRAIGAVGWPFLICIALALFKRTRNKRWLATAAFLTVVGFIFVGGDGTRTPLVFMALSLFVGYSMLWVLTARVATTVIVCILILFGVQSVILSKDAQYLSGQDSAQETAIALANRILTGNGIETVRILHAIDDGWPLRYGEIHLQQISNSIPGIEKQLPFQHEVNSLGDQRDFTSTTFATPTYLGQVYADFYLPGVVILYSLLGALVALCGRLFYKSTRSPENVAMWSILVFYAGYTAMDGPVGFAASAFVVIVFSIGFRIVLRMVVALTPSRRSRPPLASPLHPARVRF